MLVRFMKKKGYRITKYTNHGNPKNKITGHVAYFRGNGARGAFGWTKDPEETGYMRNRMAADNDKSFDKISKCAMILELPCDHEKIFSYLKILSTKESFESSNVYKKIEGIPYCIEDGWMS